MNNRIIYCLFLKKYAKGLDHICYPGKLGKRIYNNISQEAWEKWIKKQTILINENKLNLMQISDRTILEQEMKKFLFQNNHNISDQFN